MTTIASIPKIPFFMDTWAGFGQMTGLARLDASGVVFEYQTKDNLVELIKTEVRESRIAFTDIENVTYHKGWFGFFASFTITAHTLAAIQDIPGSTGNQITISIARKDREKTKQFISHISTALTERMLARELALSAERDDEGEIKNLTKFAQSRESTPS